jgi:hypothetical protein
VEHHDTVPSDASQHEPDVAVAAALDRMAELDQQPVTEHPRIYAEVHDQLRSALTAADRESE